MDSWTLTYDGFDPAEESLREALTSTGNGYFCARGAAEWQEGRAPHYPATYAHGVYNRESTIMGGRPVPNEDFVALPNWLTLQLRIEGEEPVRLEDVEVLSYRHGYDARRALVWRELRFRDRAGRETALRARRFVSMARLHQGAIAWDITPEGWSGAVELVSAIDGRVTNRGVGRYAQLESRHLDPVAVRRLAADMIALKVRTRQSSIEIAEAARTRVYAHGEELDVAREDYQTDDYIQQVLAFDVHAGETTRAEKLVALYTSHDRAIDEPLANAGKSVARYLTFDEALGDHERAWDELWRMCDMRFPADERVQFALRFHAAHVLQVCSPFTALHDAGVPARGLNGEAYRGHVFWDELYVYPFLNHRLPEITRELLMYRYRRLDEARSAAIAAGYRGAMYPWQSGSDGREETQVVHLNPLSGAWDPDVSHLQRHVNSAIVHNVWSYWQATGDFHFLRDYGAEMMLQIARFWASIAHRNPEHGRWEIHGVMGPDEFHTHYPGAAEPGLRNNAYTNAMAAWVCETALEVLDLLPAGRSGGLRDKLRLTDDEVGTWSELSTGMFVPFHGDGLISQFEGWEDLEELDWEAYRARYDNLQRLDRVLRAEGDDPNRYKVTKQADTLMLFFLFPEERLAALFRRLGYEYHGGMARRNVEYYTERTTNGSTLSFVANAGVLAPVDAERSWGSFRLALDADLRDVQGGTTGEGIHMGLMSGTLDLMQRAYAGTEVDGDVLRFAPLLLARIDGLSFPMQFRGTYLTVTIEGGRVTAAAGIDGSSRAVTIAVGDEEAELGPGDSHSFAVTP